MKLCIYVYILHFSSPNSSPHDSLLFIIDCISLKQNNLNDLIFKVISSDLDLPVYLTTHSHTLYPSLAVRPSPSIYNPEQTRMIRIQTEHMDILPSIYPAT